MNFKTIHKQSTMMRGYGLMNVRPHERINLWYLLVAITLLLLLAEMGRPQEPGKAQSQTTSPQALVPVTVTVSTDDTDRAD